MVIISDLVDLQELAQARADGLVQMTHHPSLPLVILNYTAKATYTPGAFDVHAVRQSRGLIVHDNTLEVVARPWPKFPNYSEVAHELEPSDFEAPVEVTDKLDGSLGILYPGEVIGGRNPRRRYAIATRGSFASDQALRGTMIWDRKYQDEWTPEVGWTYLFEIIYPENRIVVDYGDYEDLVLLGAVNMENGRPVGPTMPWPGPRADVFDYQSLAEALAAEPREGVEGYVVRYRGHNTMLKLKQDDYIALHRVVTGLNDRVVWEQGYGPEALDGLLGSLPDEFHRYVREVHADLVNRAAAREIEAEQAYSAIFDPAMDRKYFAGEVMTLHDRKLRAYLFMLLDGKDILPEIWKEIRPRGDTAPFARSEDEV